MKKIAILTQPLGGNYGGLVQAFVLQKILEKLGHSVVTIDRQIESRFFLFNFTRKLKRVFQRIFSNSALFLKKNADPRLVFLYSKINISKPIYKTNCLRNYFSKCKFDTVVVGSDQVWRPKYSPDIYNFFLDFIHQENYVKIAYAASFGVDNWEYSKEQEDRCKALISDFRNVSVRESSGVELCGKYLGINCELVLDPTLLFKSSDYSKELELPFRENELGLVHYVLDCNSEITNSINSLAASMGLPVLDNKYCESKRNARSVEDWIGGFKNATCVVTDSFHGCVFSIIFNKPFIVLCNNSRGAARFFSILNIVELNYRIVYSPSDVTADLMFREMDWDKINSKLELLRLKSIDFLKNSI